MTVFSDRKYEIESQKFSAYIFEGLVDLVLKELIYLLYKTRNGNFI